MSYNFGTLKIAVKLTFDKRERDQRVYIYPSNIRCRYSTGLDGKFVEEAQLPCVNTKEVFEVIRVATFKNLNHNKSYDFHIMIKYAEDTKEKVFVDLAISPRY